MRVIRYSDVNGTLKLVPELFEDLYLLARIIGSGDKVTSSSTRRFRASEGDVGEQKEVVIELLVEKAEIDRSAQRLRVTGKIESGKPEEYVRLGSYHTLSIGDGDVITVWKQEWKGYVLSMVKQAVADSKKQKLGVIAMDDEKASFAYVRGYGIDVVGEVYSRLSKRMKQKDFDKALSDYFTEIAKKANEMRVDTIVFAGPGFTKDDFGKYIESKGIELRKKTAYVTASDAERSGIREVVQGEAVSKLLESAKVKREFDLLNAFLAGLGLGASFFGVDRVGEALEQYLAGGVIVNDSAINESSVKEVLDAAYMQKVEITVFNSDDDAGVQLANFKDIAAIGKAFASRRASGQVTPQNQN